MEPQHVGHALRVGGDDGPMVPKLALLTGIARRDSARSRAASAAMPAPVTKTSGREAGVAADRAGHAWPILHQKDRVDARAANGDASTGAGHAAGILEPRKPLRLGQTPFAQSALMDHYLPDWPARRAALNRLPVRHEDWVY